MDPSSTPVEGGNSLCVMLNSRHRSGLWNSCSRKDLKSRAWVPIVLFTPSILSPTVHQNLPKPFCHMWISVIPNRQKHWIHTFFKNKCLGSVSLSSWIQSYMIAVIWLETHTLQFLYRAEWRTHISSFICYWESSKLERGLLSFPIWPDTYTVFNI